MRIHQGAMVKTTDRLSQNSRDRISMYVGPSYVDKTKHIQYITHTGDGRENSNLNKPLEAQAADGYC